MNLSENSIRRALRHLIEYGDTDLFPKLIEFDCLEQIEDEAVLKIQEVDIGNYKYGATRRFIVPKDEIAFRTATQLDPLDSIILTAILCEFGHLIEERRIDVRQSRVYSYRFLSTNDAQLYKSDDSWRGFWEKCRAHAEDYKFVACTDISDFYNQIYHHTLENQLIESEIPNQFKNWIMGLLKHVTAKVSRGIPVGPHSMHLLSEMSLIPIDNSLITKGMTFCRYSDDIVVFNKSYEDSRISLNQIAETLDQQQRLVMQKEKTKIYSSQKFIEYCDDILRDRPINLIEQKILEVLRKYSDNPYASINLHDLSSEDLEIISSTNINSVLFNYLDNAEPNYARLRWLLRRLSQLKTPSAIQFCMDHITYLIPAMSDVCNYLASSGDNYEGDWKEFGAMIIRILDHNLIQSNSYLQIVLLSLFARNPKLNQIEKLLSMYNSSSPTHRRELLLAAYMSGLGDWIRELKESYSGMDPWNRRAFIVASNALPKEERRFFLNQVRGENKLNDLLISWSKNSYHN